MKASRIIMTCLIALSIGFGTSAYAGGGKHKHRANWEQMSEQEKLEHLQKRLDRRVERLDEKLELTDTQEIKVRQILESAQSKKMDIKERHQGDRKAARAEFKQAKEATRAELATVLTAEQQQTFKTLKKDKRGKRGKRGNKTGERMLKKLDLSEQQETQVKQIMEQSRQQIRQAKEQHKGDRDAFKIEAKRVMENRAAEIEKVLDDAQNQKFQQMRERRKQRFEGRGK